jgi:hypothetical protein
MEFGGFAGSVTQLTSLIPAAGWMLPDFPPPYALFNFSCPAAPSLVGTLLVLDTGGTLCPGEITAVDCDNNVWPSGSTGWSSDGSPPCEHFVDGMSGCLGPVAVEQTTWGGVKSLYR